MEQERQKKLEMEETKYKSMVAFKEGVQSRIRPVEFQGYNNYIELLKKRIVQQEKVVEAAEKVAEKKRVELVEAMKDRKMLDTLKDKARVEFAREEQIAEQKIVDEIVSYQYNNH